jgi:hypothetical protein
MKSNNNVFNENLRVCLALHRETCKSLLKNINYHSSDRDHILQRTSKFSYIYITNSTITQTPLLFYLSHLYKLVCATHTTHNTEAFLYFVKNKIQGGLY